jgi:hypothetical protein
MKISVTTFVNATLATVLLTSLLFLAVTSSSSQQYDPWADYDANGLIDIFDVVKVAIAYGMTGDATRNVSVTNWPLDLPLFPENLILKGAIFPWGEEYRRDLVDPTTHHPPSTWPGITKEADWITGTLNATHQLYYSQVFVHQKVPLHPYMILGAPTVTITFNLTTMVYSSFKFDFLAYLGLVSAEGAWVELAALGNQTTGFMGTFNPPELFTATLSTEPVFQTVVDPWWRLAIRLNIYGQRHSGYSDTAVFIDLLCRRAADDFVVDIPIVENP